MLLITSADRVWGVNSLDDLSAGAALARVAESGGRLTVQGLPLRPGQLETVQGLASRRVSIAAILVDVPGDADGQLEAIQLSLPTA